MCVSVCVCGCVCVCVRNAFGDKDPCCRESCGKDARPEDVSAPASDNVSSRDTACHFTQPHIKKDSGGTEEKTACHLFALIQDRTEGGTGSLWECVCVIVCVRVCVFLTYVCMFCTWADEGIGFQGYFLNVLYWVTTAQLCHVWLGSSAAST